MHQSLASHQASAQDLNLPWLLNLRRKAVSLHLFSLSLLQLLATTLFPEPTARFKLITACKSDLKKSAT